MTHGTPGATSALARHVHRSSPLSSRGARPHHQAFDRGVVLVGATAHDLRVLLDGERTVVLR